MKKIFKYSIVPVLIIFLAFNFIGNNSKNVSAINEAKDSEKSALTREVENEKFKLEDWKYNITHDNLLIIQGLENQEIKNIYIPSYVVIDGQERRVKLQNLDMFFKQANDKKRFETIVFEAVAPTLSEGPIKKIEMDTISIENTLANHPVLREADLTGLEISNILNIGGLFSGSDRLEKINVSGWNVSHIKSFNGVFMETSALKTIDLSTWKTTSLESTKNMFHKSGLRTVNLNTMDTSKVKDFSSMFSNMDYVSEFEIDQWDTSSGENFSAMFSYDERLHDLDLSTFDTSKAINMSSMFYNTKFLRNLNLTNWDTSNVKDFSYMFSGKTNIPKLDVGHLNTSSAITTEGMFSNVDISYYLPTGGNKILGTLDISKYDMSNVQNMSYMFDDSTMDALDVSKWNISKVENMEWSFSNMVNLKQLETSKWDIAKVENMGYMLFNTRNVVYLDASNWKSTNLNTNKSKNIFLLEKDNKPMIVKTTDDFFLKYNYKGDKRITAGPKKNAMDGKFISDNSNIQVLFDRYTIQDDSEIIVSAEEYNKFMEEEPVANDATLEFKEWNPKFNSKTVTTNLLEDTTEYKAVYQLIVVNVDFKVTKEWEDANNQDGIRPDIIKMQLKADNENIGSPINLSKTDNWTHTWQSLPKKANGDVITYSAVEVDVPQEY
ncbi:MAG: BspA family leucine-rich repeat surface protein, partial [Coprobacillus sp.]